MKYSGNKLKKRCALWGVIESNMKILIVDDKVSIRRSMVSILKSIGFTDVTQAVDGQDAWETLEKDLQPDGLLPFDLIISDLEMPKMTGLDLLQNIRKHNRLKTIPFILATSVTAKDIILKTMRLGIQAYIIKPFDCVTVKLKLRQAGIL